MVRYRNSKTGQTIECDAEQPVFARSTRWVLLEEPPEAKGERAPSPPTGDGTKPVDLTKLKRGELNARATALGIDHADQLHNAGEVIKAIEAKQSEISTSTE